MAKPVLGINVFENNTTNALSALDANFTNITNAINDPASYTNYGIDIGAANAYVVTLAGYNFLSYANGQIFAVDIANNNTISAATLNINGLGAKQIYRQDGSALAPGDLTAGNIFQFFYNSALNGGAGGFGLSGAVTIQTTANQQFNSIGVGASYSGTAGTIVATGQISGASFSGPTTGVTSGSAPSSGQVGEFLSATATLVGLTNGVASNITSLALSAGDWDVYGNFLISAATVSGCFNALSLTSATLPGSNAITGAAAGTGATSGGNTPMLRVNVASSTTVYLVVQPASTGGTTGAGQIQARRRR